jgi:hypothetical protein
MNRRTLLLAALGIAGGTGIALAAGHERFERHGRDDHRRDGGHSDARRRRHDDDDNRPMRSAGSGAPNAPSAPDAPVPGNGLFRNGARPKVEVR